MRSPFEIGSREVQDAAIGCATLGANTILAAEAGMETYVVSLILIANVDNTIYFTDGDGVELFGKAAGPVALAASSGFDFAGGDKRYLFKVPSGKALQMVLSVAAAVGGSLNYIRVPKAA